MTKSLYSVLASVVAAGAVAAGSLTPGAAEAGSASLPAESGLIVRTSAGLVRGILVADHRGYLGIPYAAPPVGSLRWRAPQPASAWQGVRDATRPGAACPSLTGQPPRVTGSEDCLTLNVDSPRKISGRLPVMVFVHGGGFANGSGADYDPTRLVTRGNVVVVTFNYRLGALGFLDHPALGSRDAGNFGLADQQAALRWVRRNIAAFGGDPGNVTLWGQSAGAFSVCAQLASPGARGLFDKAIVQSGPCGNALVTSGVARRRGVAIAAKLGCPGLKTAATCLRARPFQDLTGLGQDQIFTVHRRIAELPWLPVAGTPALPAQPLTALRRGQAASVPLIQGGTLDEMRAFVAAEFDGTGHPVTPDAYPGIIRSLFGTNNAAAILAAYPLSRYRTPSLALARILTDEGGMLGSCTQLPADDAAAQGAPVFAYEFSEPSGFAIGDFPFGATHGTDLPYLLDGSYLGPSPEPLTGSQEVLADKLIGSWARFAHTGNPGPSWHRYAPGMAVSFSTDRIRPVDLSSEHRCAFWQSHR